VQTVEVRATEGWFGLRSGFGIGAGVGSVIGTGMMLCTLLLLTWWGCARPSASKVLLLVTLQYLFSRYNQHHRKSRPDDVKYESSRVVMMSFSAYRQGRLSGLVQIIEQTPNLKNSLLLHILIKHNNN
jgi:hypothetical protein